MKIRLSFKSPDVTDYADVMDDNGKELIKGEEVEASDIEIACKKWVQYNEYITVEIDTVRETCIVIPVGR